MKGQTTEAFRAVNFSASQAAKAVGKSIPTITRAIKSGKLSASPREGGGYIIDASELFRVWPAISNETGETLTKLGGESAGEIRALEREIELLREMMAKTEADRDNWKEQAARVTALLEDQRSKVEENRRPRKGLWGKVLDAMGGRATDL